MMNIAGRTVSLYVLLSRVIAGRGPALQDDAVCRMNPAILSCPFDSDELVLFDADDRAVYLLNHTAAAVICEIDDRTTLAEVSGRLARQFGRPTRAVAGDVKRIVRELIRKGILEMTPDRQHAPRINKDAVVREEDDGAFLFDPVTDELFAVNETGLLIVRLIDGNRSRADIVRAVMKEFSGVGPAEAAHDVDTFLDELARRGLIVT